MPNWLNALSIVSLSLSVICSLVLAGHLLAGHAQKMRIMNLVWPITALYGGPLAVVAYFKTGVLSSKRAVKEANLMGEESPGARKPFWQMAAIGSTHCGSGCTLGDLVAEWIVFAAPVTILGQQMFGAWLLDYFFAYIFGIAFQYFTIKPMKNLSPGRRLWAAIQADTLSLTAWQVGMYSWMAIAVYLIFGHEIPKMSPVFWFMMQIAMIAGFMTSYPVNWWLIRSGVKEKM